MCFCVYCMLISSLMPLFDVVFTSLIIIFVYCLCVCLWITFTKLKRSVLAPELRQGWKSEHRSPPRSLAGRPMTRQRPTGQRPRRLNSKSLLLTLWLQSREKGKNNFTSTLLILLLSVSCFEEACGLNQRCSAPGVMTFDLPSSMLNLNLDFSFLSSFDSNSVFNLLINPSAADLLMIHIFIH